MFDYMTEKIQCLKQSQVSVWWHLIYTTATIAIAVTGCYFGIQMALMNVEKKFDNSVNLITEKLNNFQRERELIVKNYDQQLALIFSKLNLN